MTSTNIGVGRQLLVAMISNNEPEFILVLDAHCRQILGNRLNVETEISHVLNQIRESEIALGLEYDLASWKMVKSEMKELLAPTKKVLLAKPTGYACEFERKAVRIERQTAIQGEERCCPLLVIHLRFLETTFPGAATSWLDLDV
ncbi:MAG: hypothetical protein NTY41_07505 [Proteobacteria bacterium]|nr:hypothetical protein [Pseudomonadota bacterium]